jgi:outer membrane protein assembly factor BamB
MQEIDWRRMPSYRCASPLSLPRRLVAAGDRVYTTLGFSAPLVALDAATGQTIKTYAGSKHTDEILLHADRLVVCLRPPIDPTKGAGDTKSRPPARSSVLMALDADTGRKLWQTDPLPLSVLSLAASGDGVFCHSSDAVLCLDLATGRQRWRTQIGGPGVPLVVFDQIVMCVGGKKLIGLSAADGDQLWQLPSPRGYGIANPPDLFVADGLVWYGQGGADANGITGYDPVTGKAVRTIDYGPLVTRGHHARCYRSKATDNYLLLPKRAVEFVDLHGQQHSRHNWVRGACRYGVLPCNGLLYSTPHPCFCYAGVKLGGFLALAPDGNAETKGTAGAEARGIEATQPRERLETGPAYGSPADLESDTDRNSDAWPAYRHDARRSGSVATVVQGSLGAVWSVDVGGRLTQPVVDNGRVFVARVDEGMVCCLDAATGEPLWDFAAGGPVDSSPTCYRGRLMFGSADGHVYNLRASDGELAWRFRAAPLDRRVVAFGHVESAWPVHGSVLVFDDTAYFTAGRSSFLDGGIMLYGLDPLSGETRHETRLDGPHPDSAVLDEAAYAMEGAKSDILVTDGKLIYLFHYAFDSQLNKQPTPVLGEAGVRNLGERKFGEHLFSNTGFLDDSWFSRNQWMLGDHWTAFNFAHQAPKEGQLVVFDETHAYAVKCFARRNRLSPLFFPATDGYFLVADRRATQAVVVNPRQQPKYLTWLPQEGELQKCWNLDVGFARATPPEWVSNVAVRIRAMVRTSNALLVAGPPDECDPDDPLAALEGRRGAKLLTFDARDGQQLDEYRLDVPPAFDGLSAAAGKLYLAAMDGKLHCLAGE